MRVIPSSLRSLMQFGQAGQVIAARATPLGPEIEDDHIPGQVGKLEGPAIDPGGIRREIRRALAEQGLLGNLMILLGLGPLHALGDDLAPLLRRPVGLERVLQGRVVGRVVEASSLPGSSGRTARGHLLVEAESLRIDDVKSACRDRVAW